MEKEKTKTLISATLSEEEVSHLMMLMKKYSLKSSSLIRLALSRLAELVIEDNKKNVKSVDMNSLHGIMYLNDEITLRDKNGSITLKNVSNEVSREIISIKRIK